jgi:hypothetical protein
MLVAMVMSLGVMQGINQKREITETNMLYGSLSIIYSEDLSSSGQWALMLWGVTHAAIDGAVYGSVFGPGVGTAVGAGLGL